MPYERDVFISYAHIDDAPLTTGTQGWVQTFHVALNGTLSQWLGTPAHIWRDEKLHGNDDFSEEILKQFPKTAVLVSVLSPRYTQSDWCTREFSEFCKAAEGNGGLFVDNHARVFKVIKMPPDDISKLPPVVDRMLGYPFYDDDDSAPVPLDPEFGDRQRQEFLLRVSKLAYDIKRVLKNLRNTDSGKGDGPLTTESPNGDPQDKADIRVYLAECTRDQRAVRDAIETELHRCGYSVLPDRELPREEREYVAEVERMLGESALAVHIVGSTYGMVPEGDSHRSVIDLQNEAAVRVARRSGLRRILWMQQGLTSAQSAQQAFIQALRTNADMQFGADLIEADAETLKACVLAALRSPKPTATDVAPDEQRRHVHVVCDERDRLAAVPLLKQLKAGNVDPTIPVFTGDAAAVREANQLLVKQADVVVLFYGSGDESWKYHQDAELRRVIATITDRPRPARFLFLADPASPDKELIRNLGETGLLDPASGSLEQVLEPLLKPQLPGKAP